MKSLLKPKWLVFLVLSCVATVAFFATDKVGFLEWSGFEGTLIGMLGLIHVVKKKKG